MSSGSLTNYESNFLNKRKQSRHIFWTFKNLNLQKYPNIYLNLWLVSASTNMCTPAQAANVTKAQFSAISDSIDSIQLLLPECEEYKNDIPLPRFLPTPVQEQVQQAMACNKKQAREDTDDLTADDWTRMDSMVVIVMLKLNATPKLCL